MIWTNYNDLTSRRRTSPLGWFMGISFGFWCFLGGYNCRNLWKLRRIPQKTRHKHGSSMTIHLGGIAEAPTPIVQELEHLSTLLGSESGHGRELPELRARQCKITMWLTRHQVYWDFPWPCHACVSQMILVYLEDVFVPTTDIEAFFQ